MVRGGGGGSKEMKNSDNCPEKNARRRGNAGGGGVKGRARRLGEVLALVAFGAAAARGGEGAFGPGMAGRFVQESRGRTRGVLEVGADGRVVWGAEGIDKEWRGRLVGPDAAGNYALELETKGGPEGLLLAHDPIAPAWAVAGRQDQKFPPKLFQKEGGTAARTRDYFGNRFVLDEPWEAATAEEAEARLAGVWANFAEGFGVHALFLSSNHLGVVFGDAGGEGLKWRALRADGEWRVLAETFGRPGGARAVALLMVADLRRESLELLQTADTGAEALEKDREGVECREWWEFHRVLDKVPEEWERCIAGIPFAAEREHAARIERQRAEREKEQRLERERPRQEEVLRSLRDNPSSLPDLEFPVHGAKSPGKEGVPLDSPELRAVNAAFADTGIPFEEAVLEAFLDKLPVRTHWPEVWPVFNRDELGPDARRRLFERVVETGDYKVEWFFFSHANTPVDVFWTARGNPDLPPDIQGVIRLRLKREGHW